MQQGAAAGIQEIFAEALRHHQAGRLTDAERLYRQVLQADSQHADALHFLGVLAHQLGRNEIAADLIQKAIAQNGRVPAFHNNLGNALKAQGKSAEAIACYGRALSQQPNHVAAHYNLGLALQEQGRLDEAVASYQQAVTYKPDHAEAHGNLGNTFQAQGKLEEAVASYQRALFHRPHDADAHGNLGNVLFQQGKLEAAVACYQHALSNRPDYAEAHSNLGNVFLQQGKLVEAVACYQRALSHKPDYAEAHHYLGNALMEQGRLSDALASYRRALTLKPDYAEARLGLAMAVIPIFADSEPDSLQTGERFARSLDELAAWAGAHPAMLGKAVGSHQPFYLAYRPMNVGGLLFRYGDQASTAAAARWQLDVDAGRKSPPPRDRIRVVIVSGQVRQQHPVWDVVLRGVLAHMDRRHFDIFLYHTDSVVDAETDWARSRVERFVQGPKPLQGWLREVAQDGPDVMFYPEVGMDPATCAMAALRLAPLQVAGWGHPITTGLPTMDLFLSGQLLEAPGAEQHYRERLVRLPGTGVCTESTAEAAERWDGPERQANTVRFALCQQPIKFDPADDVLLARIAKSAGRCEFWLASPNKLHWAAARLRERLAAAFRAEGLDPDVHLRVIPWLPRAQFAGFLDDMDVYLDCPAFSGYTTAWQAVHRGLPIVTLEGEFLRQRLAAGLLRQIGLTDGIAWSREQYVDIAVRWAEECRQSDTWAARRETMRRAAPQADGNRAAVSAFERTLIDAVQAGVRG
jgi:predicted O-linked N-acetylglucosamine transferase (SPINDLY family)